MPPPAILTSSLLTTLRTTTHLPPNTWHLLTATALSTLNRPDTLPALLTSTLTHTPQSHHLSTTRRIREALIKSSAIIGLPKTINSLLALKSCTPKELLDEPLGYSPSQRVIDMYATPGAVVLKRGQEFFEKVYGKVTGRVMGQMDRCGTEDLGLMARLEYGYVLSPSQILTPAETSLVVLACLIPQDVNPQLKGHLIGALNNGATEEEVKAVRELVIKVCEAAGMKMLDANSLDSWGWREEVANLKPKKESRL